ncbi:GNAT family N-acetyltransferase [Sporosarcina sp. BP05]|uniref:GNAT family N-acetyltransferase n=1 Tax=Sporosarcina sp. BP05 TaxID=2758726 RepID=UPI001646848B|nr:GNAT family N-acetyltransferase [Sporosarcina sp. BP05]
MKVLKAILEDAQSILDIQKVAYLSEAEAYNNYQIAPLLETLDETRKDFGEKTVLKAVLNGKIVGSVRGYEEKGTCYVQRLMVHPDHQKKGIGKSLMLELEEYFPTCDRFDLYTGALSTGNIRLYKSLGYEQYKIEMIRENIEFAFLEKVNKVTVPISQNEIGAE